MTRSTITVLSAALLLGCGNDTSAANSANANANAAPNGAPNGAPNSSTGENSGNPQNSAENQAPNSVPGNQDPGLGGSLPFAECAGSGANTSLVAAACFGDPEALDITNPLAVIEHAYVEYKGEEAVYIRLTLDPEFVDNTYGANSVGWDDEGDGQREFKKLVGSDHAQILVLDASGEVAFELKLDFISEDDTADCGHSSLGSADGDGDVLEGNEDDILGWTTSMDRNLNERGYCDFLVDSPATDANCTPNPAAPDWDYRVVYEVWIRRSAFDPNGFGTAHMTFVHASPAKGGENTVEVVRQECPCPDASTAECREDPNPQPEPEPGAPGADCGTDDDCASMSFCYQGTCLNVIL